MYRAETLQSCRQLLSCQQRFYVRKPLFTSAVFWCAAVLITVLAYWACLRLLYPGYFAPLSPFHADFYDYTGTAMLSIRALLSYPRPVAFLGMHFLATGGLPGVLAGSIAISLGGLLGILALARQWFRIDSIWLLPAFAIYLIILFAHPDFYAEHRHDLPAEISWLFLVLSLLAWTAFVRRRHRSLLKAGLLAAAVVSAILFAFAKETWFVAALCLVLGMALADRPSRRLHLGFLGFLIFTEAVSFLWTGHVNGPFVSLNTAAGDAYRINAHFGSIEKTWLYYLSELLNPGLILAALAGVAFAWPDRRRLILTASWLVAGLVVFAPQSLLPNHVFSEYAWAAAPLFMVPVLLPRNLSQAGLVILCAAIAIRGPHGYWRIYDSDVSKWYVAQDQKGMEIRRSFPAFRAVPRPARVLVTGIDDAAIPWEVSHYAHMEFGDGITWTVAFPPSLTHRIASPLVSFIDVGSARPGNFDYVARYHGNGKLEGIVRAADIPSSAPADEVLVPDLVPLVAATHGATKENSWVFYPVADKCLTWGFDAEAGRYLGAARALGADDDTYARLAHAAQDGLAKRSGDPSIRFTAEPALIHQPDHTGLGITKLSWHVPAGVSVEIHIDAPDGKLFTAAAGDGEVSTGKWVKNGMQFFLQDVSGGKPLATENTLAIVTVDVAS